jgi:hypothetical protein
VLSLTVVIPWRCLERHYLLSFVVTGSSNAAKHGVEAGLESLYITKSPNQATATARHLPAIGQLTSCLAPMDLMQLAELQLAGSCAWRECMVQCDRSADPIYHASAGCVDVINA